MLLAPCKTFFSRRFNLIAKEEVMSMLTGKRKASSTPAAAATDQSNKQAKKIKIEDSSVTNGEAKQSATDCRQIPFQGIQA